MSKIKLYFPKNITVFAKIPPEINTTVFPLKTTVIAQNTNLYAQNTIVFSQNINVFALNVKVFAQKLISLIQNSQNYPQC